MTTAVSIDLGVLARELELPVEQVQRTLQLLDDGNTIPFITRYRKDRTGGLNEEQIQRIQEEVVKLRLLAERKQTILRSIETQGKLTPELAAKINSARTLKWLEDVYLPYKPKKQTLATVARQRGLEPLAIEILEANPAASDLQARLASFVSAENGLNSADEVLHGVGHILAEIFSERVDIRSRLRKALRRDAVLTCSRIETTERTPPSAAPEPSAEQSPHSTSNSDSNPVSSETPAAESAPAASDSGPSDVAAEPSMTEVSTEVSAESAASEGTHEEDLSQVAVERPSDESNSATATTTEAAENLTAAVVAQPVPQLPAVVRALVASQAAAKKKAMRKQLARERKKKLLEHAFKDYYNFREPISRLPPHRVLAINRGERAKVLRVRIDYNADALMQDAIKHLVPQGHPHGEFLTSCARDSLQRLVLPSLERELRRELAEEAEEHAVQVFVRNLRKLLLQPPVRGKRVLAVDPGFRSGCKLAAIDPFGKLLEYGTIHLVGGDEQRQHARTTLADFIRRYQVELVAIGNGAGCRAAEQIVSDVIGAELNGTPIAYVIVNEAGASVYSTSQVGRDELPHCDPMMRSAVSIGRRLQDPLSELVKINPANIGVGMYQHDMKLKHLRESLDAVVNSCVNFVGVELNSASPSLLGYVSGLNQLTARRVFEYRQQHGPFRNREQIKEVPGIGEATFVQAAGFLRISDSDNPLDATWIHPESYEIARRVLERIDIPLSELTRNSHAPIVPSVESTPETISAESETKPAESTVQEPASANLTPELPTPAETSSLTPTEAAPVTAPADQSSLASDIDFAPPDLSVAPTVGDSPNPAANTPVEASPVATETGSAPEGPTGASVLQSQGTTDAVAQPAAAVSELPPAPPSPSLIDRLNGVDVAQMAQELGIGELSLRDILSALAKPGRDPRDDFSPPPFRTGIMKLDDLKPGMELQGTVLNVVDFGAFVDIGISDSALIHISKLADRFIRDPQEVVSVGDILKVWVIEVDRERRRVSLTAIDPSQVRRPHESREGRGKRFRPQKPAAAAAQGTPPAARQPAPQKSYNRQQQQRPPQNAGKRPPRKPQNRSSGPPPKPKPVRPITSAMLNGKQPMRSFSDLMQFYEKKQQDPEEPK